MPKRLPFYHRGKLVAIKSYDGAMHPVARASAGNFYPPIVIKRFCRAGHLVFASSSIAADKDDTTCSADFDTSFFDLIPLMERKFAHLLETELQVRCVPIRLSPDSPDRLQFY